MADKKEHGPHPFALLREWKLSIKRTLQAHAKTELEYYKLAEFVDCLLLFSPTLDAGKVSFRATFAQIQELHNDVTRKSIYNRAERLKEMGILSWEQPEAKKKGEFNPTVWTVSKISAGKKDGGENSEGKKDGVPEGKKDRVPRVKDGGLQDFTREDFTRSGLSTGHTGHSSGHTINVAETDKTEDTDQNSEPLVPEKTPFPVQPPVQIPVKAPCNVCAHLASGSCPHCGRTAGGKAPTETPGAAAPPAEPKKLGAFDPRELNEAVGNYSAEEVAKIVQWHWVESKNDWWRDNVHNRAFFDRNLEKMAAQVPAVWLKPSQKPNTPTITAAPGVHGNKSGFKW